MSLQCDDTTQLTLLWDGIAQSSSAPPHYRKPGGGCCVWLRIWYGRAVYTCRQEWYPETGRQSPSLSPAHAERQAQQPKLMTLIKQQTKVIIHFKNSFKTDTNIEQTVILGQWSSFSERGDETYFILYIYFVWTNKASSESSQDFNDHRAAVALDCVERTNLVHFSSPANLLPHNHPQVSNEKCTLQCLKKKTTHVMLWYNKKRHNKWSNKAEFPFYTYKSLIMDVFIDHISESCASF